MVKILINKDPDTINYTWHSASGVEVNDDREGLSALMIAVRSQRSKMVKILIEEGAALDLTDTAGKAALIITCKAGQRELSRLLIEKGANVNHLDHEGGYALLYAVRYYQYNTDAQHDRFEVIKNLFLVELLLEKGAKADAVTRNGETALGIMLNNDVSLMVQLQYCIHIIHAVANHVWNVSTPS